MICTWCDVVICIKFLNTDRRRANFISGIASYLVRERLREGTKLRNYDMLRSAVPAFLESGLKEEDNDLTKAKQTLQILETERGKLA